MSQLDDDEVSGVQLEITVVPWLCTGETSLLPSPFLLRIAWS